MNYSDTICHSLIVTTMLNKQRHLKRQTPSVSPHPISKSKLGRTHISWKQNTRTNLHICTLQRHNNLFDQAKQWLPREDSWESNQPSQHFRKSTTATETCFDTGVNKATCFNLTFSRYGWWNSNPCMQKHRSDLAHECKLSDLAHECKWMEMALLKTLEWPTASSFWILARSTTSCNSLILYLSKWEVKTK